MLYMKIILFIHDDSSLTQKLVSMLRSCKTYYGSLGSQIKAQVRLLIREYLQQPRAGLFTGLLQATL